MVRIIHQEYELCYGFINLEGKAVIQPEYEMIKSNEKYEDSSCTVFASKKDGVWYLIDVNGSIVF